MARRALLALCCCLLVAPCTAAQQQQPDAAGSAVVCELRLAGRRGDKHLASAHLSCRGGSITAAAHKELARLLPHAPPGVAWSPSSCGKAHRGCLLTVCGDSAATFVKASVTDLALDEVDRLVCVGDRARLTWQGASFVDNLTVRPLTAYKGTTLHLIASHFERNSHDMGGGALYTEGVSLVIEASSFTGNRGVMDGGALCLQDGTHAQLASCHLLNNTAGGTTAKGVHAAGGGGGIDADNSSLVIRNSMLVGNIATLGAGMRLSGRSTATISGSTLRANTAQNSGGGIRAIEAANVTLANVRLLDNTADTLDGGGLAVFGTARVVLTGTSLVQGNRAGRWGGGIFLDEASRLTAQHGRLQLLNNTADYGGGLLATNRSIAVLRGATIAYNAVGESGGGAYADGNATLTLERCNMSANTAVKFGGGLDALGNSSVLLESVRLLNNTARDADGGGIALGGSPRLVLRGASLLAGNSGRWGGAVFADSLARFAAAGARFADNGAAWGGAVCAQGNSSVALYGCRFERHAVSGRGGTLQAAGSASLTASGCTVVESRAESGGVLALAANATVRLQACNFSSATVQENGGCIHTGDSTTLILLNVSIASCSASSGGGGLYMRDSSRAVLTDSSFDNCRSRDDSSGGGCASVLGNASLSMAGGRVTGCEAEWGAGLNTGERARVLADRVLIASNFARGHGAGGFADGSATLSLRACNVHNCSAGISGGGLAIASGVMLKLSAGTRISQCAAGGAGGGLRLLSPNFDPAAVRAAASNNTAARGPDVSVATTHVRVVGSRDVPNFVSRLDGGALNITLNITGFYELPCVDTVEARVQGALDDLLNTTQSGPDGIARLTLKLRQPPGAYTIIFRVVENADVPPASITVHVANCSEGDIMLSSGDACETCPQGHFSLDPRKSQCDLCPSANAECPGGSAIVPKAGYWHSAPHSAQIHRCLNPDACRGGVNTSHLPAQLASGEGYKTAQCADGYQGNLCAVCAPGHGTARAFTCRACMPRRTILALYVLAALAMLGAVRLLVHFTLADSTDEATASSQPQPVDLLKPLVLYSQWLFIISSLANVPWPATLLVPLQGVAWFWSSASGSSLSLDCVLPRDSGVPLAMQKVLLSLCVPLALLLVLLAGEVVLQRCSRRRRAAAISMGDRVASVLMCVVFVFLPTWARTAFSLFACVPLDRPVAFPFEVAAVGSFWTEDTAQACFAAGSGRHRAWALGLGVPLVLALCVVLPGGIAAFVWRNRARLGRPAFRRHYGFLYRAWCDGTNGTRWVPWWESVVTLETLVLVAISAFGWSLGAYYQSLALCAALGIVLALLAAVRPHANAVAGRVSLQGTGVLYVTCFSALTFLPYAPYADADSAPHQAYGLVLGAVVLALNVAFVASALWRLVHAVDWAGAVGGVRRATAAAGRKAAACCSASCPAGEGALRRLPDSLRSAHSLWGIASMPAEPRSKSEPGSRPSAARVEGKVAPRARGPPQEQRARE